MIKTRRAYLRVLHGLVASGHVVVAAMLLEFVPAAVAVGLAGLAWAVSAWRVQVISGDPPRPAGWVRWVDMAVCCHVAAGLFGLCLWPAVVAVALVLRRSGALFGQIPEPSHAAPAVAYAIGLALAVWAATAGRLWVRLRTVVVHVPGWPAPFDGYRIVHLSDLHVGGLTPLERARRWIERARAIPADLVVVTGDLVASGTTYYPAVAGLLGGLRAPDGVLVVTGNHDLWDRAALERHLEARGVSVLDGRLVEIVRGEAHIVVAGIGASRRPASAPGRSLARLPGGPTLLLAHDPAVFEAAARAGVRLTLSGHTHAGQVALPLLGRWANMARLAATYTWGLYRIGESQLYVNAGLGITGLPVRLWARPEIVVLQLFGAMASASTRPYDRGRMHRLAPGRRKRANVGVWLLLAASACARAEPALVPRPSLLDDARLPTSALPAASWRYHPSQAGEIYAERKIGSRQMLLVGAHGERWVVDPISRRASSSAWLAPETLVGIDESSQGGWQFVGVSGTVYETASPLGPFERSSAPPLPFVTVHAESGPIVGVRADGSLSLSTDGGLSWRSVGPRGVRFADAAVDERGRVLGLATPEAIWSSAEDGSDWSRLSVDTFGAVEILRNGEGRPCARGVFGVRCWQPEQRSLLPFAGKLAPRAHKLDATLPLGEDAAALTEGRAVISQGHYFELVRVPGWRLLSGPFGGSLSERDAEPLKSCQAVRISAFGARLVVGCMAVSPQSRTAQTVRFFSSADQGQSWTEEPFVTRASSELRLALGADGALLVTGICPPYQSEAGCVPSGIYFRGRPPRGSTSKKTGNPARQEPWALLPAAAPGLSGVAEALAFSPDGYKAYAVGSYSKTGGLGLFVSPDQGRHFWARDLEPQSSDAASRSASKRTTAAGRVEGLGTLPDGTVSVVFRGVGGHPTLVVTDEAGRSLSSVDPPAETKLLAAAGGRALALSPDTTTLFESLDGGSRWQRAGPLPVLLCARDRDCRVPIHCSQYGCVFTDVATRVGWGTAPEPGYGLLPPPEAEAARVERRLRTPIACVLDPATQWARIAGADGIPTAAQSALGETVWFVATSDPSQASVGMAMALRSRGQVTELSLLAPVRAPEQYAVALVSQVEGAAAMRYRTPESTKSTALLDIEVVWDNLFEGQLRRAKIGDAGAYEPGDYAKTSERSERAQPSLLSITQGGIYVMPHQGAGTNQPAYFLDGKRVVVVPPLSWPALGTLSAHTEMLHVQGHHVGLALLKGGAAVVLGRIEGNATSFAAHALGLSNPDAFGMDQSIDMTYLGGAPALFSSLSTRSGEGQFFVFPLQASGPPLGAPIAVPGPASASDPPRACDRATRESTPRLVVPSPIGSLHPVLVTGGTEPARAMLTSQAVMHGTTAAPCVAVLESQGVVLGDTETTQERALLPLDELERSWLFRLVERTEGRAVEVRPMRCRFDPQAAVVPELMQAELTSRT